MSSLVVLHPCNIPAQKLWWDLPKLAYYGCWRIVFISMRWAEYTFCTPVAHLLRELTISSCLVQYCNLCLASHHLLYNVQAVDAKDSNSFCASDQAPMAWCCFFYITTIISLTFLQIFMHSLLVVLGLNVLIELFSSPFYPLATAFMLF